MRRSSIHFARVVHSIQLQVLFMENFDSQKPTAEVSSGQSEEDDLFAEVDIDGSNGNDDLPAKSSSFLRQLNQSLHNGWLDHGKVAKTSPRRQDTFRETKETSPGYRDIWT
jgi:hypothetical protein